jgi:membrane-bound lytic murein transglycosylase D
MKSFNIFTALLIISGSSCSHVSKAGKSKNIVSTPDVITKSILEDDEVLEKEPNDNEYTHEIVEASAEDKEIEEKVGSKNIDEELTESPEVRTKNDSFLHTKNTRRMQFWVNYFLEKDRSRFQRFINNGEAYRHHIEEIFSSYNLPKELYYVGLIESGYYLGAKSRASAVGPWQFIKGTGRRYGLRIARDIDERKDLFKATHAAARYLRDLHNVFSSWELALSAYNAGEYGILRRIMKYKTRDYYELSKNKQLPTETINYVPKVLAAMHIVNNAEKYGFVIPEKSQRIFDKTELHPVKRNVSLWKISKKLNVNLKLLKKLNPELSRNRTPRYYSGTYQLRVPSGLGAMLKAPEFRETRKNIIRRTAKRSSTSYHKVRRGETLLQIAHKYGTSAGNLAALNNLKSWRSKVRIGQRLKVSGKRKYSRTKVAKANRPIVYRVRPGDNLSSLAKLFKLRVSQIKRVNNLRSGKIFVGQKIVLPNTKKGVYTVRRGDHLGKIARKFNQPMAAILKLNALKRKTIFPGQKIIVDID